MKAHARVRGGAEATPRPTISRWTTSQSGHVIEGPAILEAESTTFAIPPDRQAWLDEHRIFHLENKEA